VETRKLRIEGDVAYVPLTRGYEAIVDIEDAGMASGYNWYVMFCGENLVYAARNERVTGKRKTILMHRVVANPSEKQVVDHRDHNGLNNRKSNLRVCSHTENIRNSRKRLDNTSGYRGVCWNKKLRKWQAEINVNGEVIYLGTFKDIEKAYQAYCKASRRYHKDYSNIGEAEQ